MGESVNVCVWVENKVYPYDTYAIKKPKGSRVRVCQQIIKTELASQSIMRDRAKLLHLPV